MCRGAGLRCERAGEHQDLFARARNALGDRQDRVLLIALSARRDQMDQRQARLALDARDFLTGLGVEGVDGVVQCVLCVHAGVGGQDQGDAVHFFQTRHV